MALPIDIATVTRHGDGDGLVSYDLKFRILSGTYNCHTCEDGKSKPGPCHGRNLREPSFQADYRHFVWISRSRSLFS